MIRNIILSGGIYFRGVKINFRAADIYSEPRDILLREAEIYIVVEELKYIPPRIRNISEERIIISMIRNIIFSRRINSELKNIRSSRGI